MHWRALIELLALMPAPKREALCNLRFSLVSGPGLVSPGGIPAVRSVVDRPGVPMDWTSGRVASGGAVKRVLGRGQGVEPRTPATGAYGFLAPWWVPLFSLNTVPSPRLASMGRGILQSVVGGHREEDHRVSGPCSGRDGFPSPSGQGSPEASTGAQYWDPGIPGGVRRPPLGSGSTWWEGCWFMRPQNLAEGSGEVEAPSGICCGRRSPPQACQYVRCLLLWPAVATGGLPCRYCPGWGWAGLQRGC